MTASVRGIAPEGRDGTVDRDNHRTYTVVYYVTTTDKNDGPAQARNAFGIPAMGSVYVSGNDFDNAAAVVDIQATQRDSPTEWEVEVTYDTQVDEEPKNEGTNPLNEPPDITWGAQSRRVIVPGKYNDPGVPNADGEFELGIMAPNGILFEPGPEMDLSDPVLTVTRNIATFDVAEVLSWANTVNQNIFLGAPRRTLKMTAPQVSSRWNKEIGDYWSMSVSMTYRFEKWDFQILNVSGQYLTASSTKLEGFKDSEGHARTGLLTETGQALNSSGTEASKWGVFDSSLAEPTYTRLRVYREIDFAALGLL